MRLSRVWLVGAGLLLATASFADAGIRKGNGELGFDFGVTAWDDDLAGRTGPLLKLRGGYLLTNWFEIEAQVAYSVHFDEQEDFGGDRTYEDDQTMTQYFVSGVFNFPSKSGNIIPYVLAGIGKTNVSFPTINFGEGSLDDDSSAWQAAAGSRFFFGDHDQVAFRIEVAFIFDDAFEQSNRHDQYAVGFTWRLGGGS